MGREEPQALDEVWELWTCKELAEKDELSEKMMRHSGERYKKMQKAVPQQSKMHQVQKYLRQHRIRTEKPRHCVCGRIL